MPPSSMPSDSFIINHTAPNLTELHGAVLTTNILGEQWTVSVTAPEDGNSAAWYNVDQRTIWIAPDVDFDTYFTHEVFEILLNEFGCVFHNYDNVVLIQATHTQLDAIAKCYAGAVRELTLCLT